MRTYSISPQQQQILGLDLARFAAALVVVFYHLGFIARAPSNPLRAQMPIDALPFDSPPTFWYGFIGVQIFFVISGFIIPYSGERSDPVRFFRDRLVRLGPALWICATLSLLLFVVFSNWGLSSILERYIREITFFPFSPWLNPVVWTLSIEIVFYGLVFLLLLAGRFAWIRHLAIGLTCVSLAFHLVVWRMDCHAPDLPANCIIFIERARLFQLSLLTHGCFFAFGIFLWLWLVKAVRLATLWWAPLALLACVLEIMEVTALEERVDAHVNFDGVLPEGIAITAWLIGVSFIIASVHFNQQLFRVTSEPVRKAIRIVGLSTYPLYLVHYGYIALFIWILTHSGTPLSAAAWVSALAVSILSIGIAIWLERPLQAKTRSLLNSLGKALSEHIPQRALQLLEHSPEQGRGPGNGTPGK